jgi:hypothetical protein
MSEQSVMGNIIKTPAGQRTKGLLVAGAVLAFFILFGFWSGVPTGERALPFWIGIIVLLIILVAFSGAAWHLLFRPLPKGQGVRDLPIKATYRQLMALLLGVGGFGIVVGTFWDEVWHRQYGIPFGDDFFWRPHLLMYFGFLAAIGLAFAGLYLITRQGQGTFQQRFRANPVIGLLILVGGFLMYVLPADPIWHGIYGEDLTAWSIPHLLVVSSFVLILLLATAIHMTTQPRREWGTLRQFRLADLLPLLMFATISLIWNQFFMVEWDSAAMFVLERPEWLLPVLIVGGAVFIGVMANHTLRMVGAATLSGLLGLAIRFGLIQLFGVQYMMFVNAWLLALPLMILIDFWYAYRRGSWIGVGIVAGLGMSVLLLTIFRQFYALFPIANLPVTLIVLLIGSFSLSWLGKTIGDYLAEGNKDAEEVTQPSRIPLVSVGAVGAVAAFIIFFVTTASPPV